MVETRDLWYEEEGDILIYRPTDELVRELTAEVGHRPVLPSYGRMILSLKEDVECPHEGERCFHMDESMLDWLFEYAPRSYKEGEMCESCWLDGNGVKGVGWRNCPHGRKKKVNG